MKRKIKKYDVIHLVHKESNMYKRCDMGDHLVLAVKPEGIKLFSIRSRNILEYTLKEFAKKYEVKYLG